MVIDMRTTAPLTPLLFLLIVFAQIMTRYVPKVEAAACTNNAQYGQVTLSADIPTAGEYVVWVRLQPATVSSNLLKLEINGNTCYSLGSTTIPAASWTWVNFHGNQQTNIMKYNFTTTGSKAIKLFGLSPNMKIDKIILLGSGEQCASNGVVPIADGGNCASGVMAAPNEPDEVLPVIVSNNADNVARVEYLINGQTRQTVTGAQPLDIGSIPSGTYELTTKVTLMDGTVIESKESLSLDNPSDMFAGIKMWVEDYRTWVIAALIIVGASAVGAFVFYGMRVLHHRKMYLKHHGLSR